MQPAGNGLRDVHTYLPPGLIVNPASTTVRCTEVEFLTGTCPDASVVGRTNVSVGLVYFGLSQDGLYNMVPPPGVAASFGFAPASTGLNVHILGGLHPGDYRISGIVKDVPSLYYNPVYASQLQFWGDPSSPAYDHNRGFCINQEAICTVPKQSVPAVTLPTSCSSANSIEAEIDSRGDPGNFISDSAPFTDLDGNPADRLTGCNAVPFKPSLSAQPTTNLADSPTGLNVDLHIPQSESLSSTATAHLKDATVTLPEGLVVNPSSANGLAGCTPEQIGINASSGVANGNPVACPDASKIGTVEVDLALLAQYDAANKVERNPQGNVIAEPIPGSVYLAKPFDNPFGSLLAIYLVVNDPRRGHRRQARRQGRCRPQTGQLTTTFEENPQLPFEDFKLHFFGGARGAADDPAHLRHLHHHLRPHPLERARRRRTPTRGLLPDHRRARRRQPARLATARRRTHPAFNAGTDRPQAGAYSPLVLTSPAKTAPSASTDRNHPARGLPASWPASRYCSEAGARRRAAAEERQR